MTGIQQVCSRIAPTPSGYLHIGNLYSFVLTWLMVKLHKGKLLLRIDDLDSQRVREEYLDDIFETLAFIGLEPDEGPSGTEDFVRNYSQRQRLPLYQSILDTLIQNKMLFGCTCSRKEIMAAAPEGLYRGTCSEKNLPLHTTGIAWRINTQKADLVTFNDQVLGPVQVDLHRLMPYFVVRKKDGDPAYQVASLADDLHWKINLVVRGNDLLHSTAAQLFLANCAGINDFAQTKFLHHALLTGAHQEKLSKSAGSFSVRAMRRSGAKAADVVALIASHLGLGERHCGSLDDLLDAFSESALAQKLTPASW